MMDTRPLRGQHPLIQHYQVLTALHYGFLGQVFLLRYLMLYPLLSYQYVLMQL